MYGYVRTEHREQLARVAELVAQRAAIEEEIRAVVTAIRGNRLSEDPYVRRRAEWSDYDAASWADIGQALGVSKQAAQRRYGR